jgi:hypothetical protein
MSINYDKVFSEEAACWKEFKDLLLGIQSKYQSDNKEISYGLNLISGKWKGKHNSILANFFYNPCENKLQITRYDIYNLWLKLTSIDEYKRYFKNNPSREIIELRKELKTRKVDDLLICLGFLPIDSEAIVIDSSLRKTRVLNVMDSLNSSQIPDNQFLSLVDAIENLIDISDSQGSRNKPFPPAIWLERRLRNSKTTTIERNKLTKEFYEALKSRDLVYRSKYFEIELEALFQSILFKILRKRGCFIGFDFGFSVSKIGSKVISCEIPHHLQENIKAIESQQEWIKTSLIRNIIQISVEGKLRHNCEEESVICFDYNCNITFLAGLISAIMRGLGVVYYFQAERFHIKHLGSSIENLIDCRATISLKDKNDSNDLNEEGLSKDCYYSGRWVGNDTIISFAQSLVEALEDGTIESFANARNISARDIEIIRSDMIAYYDIVSKISNLKSSLQSIWIYENQFSILSKRDLQDLKRQCELVINRIEQLSSINFKIEEFYSFISLGAYRIKCLVILEEARLQMLKSYPNEAINILRNTIDRDLRITEPIKWLYEAELSIISLIVGYKNVNSVVELNKSLSDVLNDYNFQKYMDLSFSNSDRETYYSYPGVDIYLGISELLGRMGQIRFYLALPNKHHVSEKLKEAGYTIAPLQQQLKDATEFLLTASCFSARIGMKHRSAHWLLISSRAFARLGKFQKAESLREEAKIWLSISNVPSLLSADISQRIMLTEFYLSKGEAFYLKGKFRGAAVCLIQALQCAVCLGLPLRLADVAYNLGRTILKLRNDRVDQLLRKIPQFERDMQFLSSLKDASSPDSPRQKALDWLGQLQDIDGVWGDLGECLICIAQQFWNDNVCSSQDRDSIHFLSDLMEGDIPPFLGFVLENSDW